jgi:hypothetical protein
MAVVTVLRLEQEPGSTAPERRYSEGAAVPETVDSVRKDEGLGAQTQAQRLTATCACLRCMGGSGAIGWRGMGSVWASIYSSSSSSSGGGPMFRGG